jgi:hypothetical protein
MRRLGPLKTGSKTSLEELLEEVLKNFLRILEIFKKQKVQAKGSTLYKSPGHRG